MLYNAFYSLVERVNGKIIRIGQTCIQLGDGRQPCVVYFDGGGRSIDPKQAIIYPVINHSCLKKEDSIGKYEAPGHKSFVFNESLFVVHLCNYSGTVYKDQNKS